MVNESGEGIAAFLAMPETRQIAQPKNLVGEIWDLFNKFVTLLSKTFIF